MRHWIVGNTSVASVAVLVLCSLALLAPDAHAVDTSVTVSFERTRMHIYSPWLRKGGLRPNIAVLQRSTAECIGGSNVSNRRDAWRCFTRRVIRDPCFSNPWRKSRLFACPVQGKLDVVAILKQKKSTPLGVPLSAPQPVGVHVNYRFPPWKMGLANRGSCVAISGMGGEWNGQYIGWSCTNGLTLGNPDRGQMPWTIGFIESSEATLSGQVMIADAWW